VLEDEVVVNVSITYFDSPLVQAFFSRKMYILKSTTKNLVSICATRYAMFFLLFANLPHAFPTASLGHCQCGQEQIQFWGLYCYERSLEGHGSYPTNDIGAPFRLASLALPVIKIHGTSAPTSVASIAMKIPEDVDLSTGLAYSSKKVTNVTCVKDYLGMLSSADNPTSDGRAASFLSYSASKVQIEFEIIARKLRRSVIESVARDKHGPEGVRILRLLSHLGKMDEKQVMDSANVLSFLLTFDFQISKVVMMAPKDVRPLLVALSTDSLISTQEVPKSADRNPARMFYLWYVELIGQIIPFSPGRIGMPTIKKHFQ